MYFSTAFAASALRGYRGLVEQIAADHVESWTPGTALHTLDRMNDLTLEVIMRVVFGVSDPRRRELLAPRLRRIVNINPIMLFGGIWPRLQTLGPWRRMRENQDALSAEWANFSARMAPQLRSLEQAGIMYRLAPPGARIADGMLQANSEFPGQIIEYRTGGPGWTRFTAPVRVNGKVELRTRSFDGRRTSRVVDVSAS